MFWQVHDSSCAAWDDGLGKWGAQCPVKNLVGSEMKGVEKER